MKKSDLWSPPWFIISILGVFFLSSVTHFWRLDQFNVLVFDEVYYAKFAINYLNQVSFFDAHPPLGKYLIALGIWLANHFPFYTGTPNYFTGAVISPFSYRWLDALTGSVIPLIVMGIAYQLSHRSSYAIIAGLFTAADGLLLVESRFALINIYLIFFGLLGNWFFLLGLAHQKTKRKIWLALAGVCFGAAIAVKWNGLGFLLGIYLLWLIAWGIVWLQKLKRLLANLPRKTPNLKSKSLNPLPNLTQINLPSWLVNLGIIPTVVYCLIWIPHLLITSDAGFWEIHRQILAFHQNMGNGTEVHPYCSAWYTCPLMLRPILYFYEKTLHLSDPVPLYPPLPPGVGKIVYAVQAMGNPFLWWTGTVAMIMLAIAILWMLIIPILVSKKTSPISQSPDFHQPSLSSQTEPQSLSTATWIALYLVINYIANFFPWIFITRCTFIYLYIPASIFTFLGIAWLTDHWLRSHNDHIKILGITIICLICLSFLFWLPVYIGLPLSLNEHQMRIWLPSWL